MTGGTYGAAVALARATDQLRVLSSVGRATDYDRESVRTALARWQGLPAPRSLRGANRHIAQTQASIGRYVDTGVWR